MKKSNTLTIRPTTWNLFISISGPMPIKITKQPWVNKNWNRAGNGKYLNLPEQQGWIDSLDFKVNGESIRWEYDEVIY